MSHRFKVILLVCLYFMEFVVLFLVRYRRLFLFVEEFANFVRLFMAARSTKRRNSLVY